MQQRFLLQILLLAQLVSGTTMPIIMSSRVLYSGCCLWYFVLWFSSYWSGVELRVMCPVCSMLQHPANRTHNPQLYNTLELLMMGIVVPETCLLVYQQASCKPDTYPSAPHQTSNLKTTARNTTGSNHCIILLSS